MIVSYQIYQKSLRKSFKNKLEIFENIFLKYQTGLITMINTIRIYLDHGGEYTALLTDISKAFDCPRHNLFIAKLYA